MKRHTKNTIHYLNTHASRYKYILSRQSDVPSLSIILHFALWRDAVLPLDVALLAERATAYTSFLVMIVSLRNGQRL